MKNIIMDFMNEIYENCEDYAKGAKVRINSIIANVEELFDIDKKINDKEIVNKYPDAVIELNLKKKENLYNDFQKMVDKNEQFFDIERQHLSMLLINALKVYDEQEEIKKLNAYVEWNKEIVKNIHNAFQSVVGYIKFLQDNYQGILNEKLLNNINKEIKEMVEFMNDFYNNGYQEILGIEEQVKKIMQSSKR